MKIKCFEKWSKFQHGIGYWLGAIQATSHWLNQCWHSSSTHIYVSRRDWIEYYATIWSWWSYNDRNGYVVKVAARVVSGGAEACFQRLRWWMGRSSWRRVRVIDKIAMRSYVAGSLYIGCGGHWRNNTYSWVVVAFYFQTIRNSPVK